jgi:Uma2 family endonuclease
MARLQLPENILEARRRAGGDQWDELWDGELHMVPIATVIHREIESLLTFWLHKHWAEPNGCRAYWQINVSEPDAWPKNYRIPDVVMYTPERFDRDRNEYFNGGPDAVVEIHCPDDEAYEKLGFYAKVGVREVWIIDRDSRFVQIFEFDGEVCHARQPDAEGWITSLVAGAEMRTEDGKLAIQLIGRPETLIRLPEIDETRFRRTTGV